MRNQMCKFRKMIADRYEQFVCAQRNTVLGDRVYMAVGINELTENGNLVELVRYKFIQHSEDSLPELEAMEDGNMYLSSEELRLLTNLSIKENG